MHSFNHYTSATRKNYAYILMQNCDFQSTLKSRLSASFFTILVSTDLRLNTPYYRHGMLMIIELNSLLSFNLSREPVHNLQLC